MFLPDNALRLAMPVRKKMGLCMKDLSGLEIKDYFRIFWYRRWYFIIVFALVSIGGTLYARMRPDVYKSEAKIMVDIPLAAISRSSASIKERVDTVREQLSSRSFLEKMIQQTGSYGYGESDFAIERALDSVRKTIRIESTSDRTFRITYWATDPFMAQNVTNQFTQELIRVSRRSERDRIATTDRFIEERFIEAEAKINEQNEKIRIFKQQNAGKLPEQAISNQNALSGYRTDLNNVENAIQQARLTKENMEFVNDERRYAKEQYAQVVQSSNANPAITKDSSQEERELAQKIASLSKYEANLAQALSKYTENHPDIPMFKREIGRLEQEIDEARAKMKSSSVAVTDGDADATPSLTVSDIEEQLRQKEFSRRISSIEGEIAKREKERDELKQKIEDLEFRIKTAPTLEQELSILLRDLALYQKDYDQFSTRKLDTAAAKAAETDKENEVYRVIDDAHFPMFPEPPNRVQIILMSFCAGLVAGIVVAFGRELIDSTVGSEEEAKKAFNLNVLAAIPIAPKKKKKRKQEKRHEQDI